MKKSMTFALASLMLILQMESFALKPGNAEQISPAPEGNEQFPIENLNGKPGVFMTYDDFLKGKSVSLTFERWHYLYTAGGFQYFKARFKDAAGKTVDYSAEEIWGFRSNNGEFYRTMPFESNKVSKIFYMLNYMYDKYCLWYSPSMSQVSLEPGYVYTTGINGSDPKSVWEHKGYKNDQKSPALKDDCYSKYVVKEKDYPYTVDYDATAKQMKSCKAVKLIKVIAVAGEHNTHVFGIGKKNTPDTWKYIAINP